jgi:hypothetical protein
MTDDATAISDASSTPATQYLSSTDAVAKLSQLMGAQKEPPVASKVAESAEPEKPPAENSEVEQTQDETEPVAETEEEYFPSSVDELAESLGVTPQKLLKLRLTAKVDGIESHISVQDALKSYQLEKHNNKKSMDLADRQKAWEADAAQRQQQLAQTQEALGQRLKDASNLINVAQNELLADFQKIKWDELRENDPAEWSAKQREMEIRHLKIQQRSQQINTEIYQQQTETNVKQKAEFDKYVANQKTQLLAKVPEWGDPKIAEKKQAEVTRFLLDNGYTREDIAQIYDHRHLLLVEKAMKAEKYEELPAKAKLKLKATKDSYMPSSGKRVGHDVPRDPHLTNLQSAFTKSRSGKDAAALIGSLMSRKK